MKKLIMLFTMLISFFVFFISFEEFSFHDYVSKREIAFNIGLYDQNQPVSLEFSLPENRNEVIDELLILLDDMGANAFIGESGNGTSYNRVQNYYFYSKDERLIQQLYPTIEKSQMDFSKSSLNYYTSDSKDKNSNYHLNYVNKKYNEKYYTTLSIYPMDSIKNSDVFKEDSFIIVHFYVKDVEQFLDEVSQSNLSSYTDVEQAFTLHDDYANSVDSELSIKLLVVISLTMLLLGTCFVLRMRKEIILRKIYGTKTITIVKKMFFVPLLIIIGIYAIIEIVCFMLYVGNACYNSLQFAYLLFRYFLLFVAMLLICLFVITIFIRYFVSWQYIKKGKETRMLIGVNLLLKAIAIIVLMQPLMSEGASLFNSLSLYNYLQNEKKDFQDNIYLAGIKEEPGKIKEVENKVYDYYDQNGGYYQNFEIEIFKNDEFFKNQDVFKEILPDYPFPYLEANTNYINNYLILNENNKKINARDLEDETLLVPIKYKEENLEIYGGSNVVFIQEGVIYQRNTMKEVISDFTLKDPIVKVFKKIPKEIPVGANFAVVLPIDDEQSKNKFDQFMKAEGFLKKVDVNNTSDDYDVIFSYTKSNIVSSAFVVLLFAITLILFLFETIYFIVIQEQKEYALRYMFGANFIERYGHLFLINFSVYIVVGIAGVLQQIRLFDILVYVLSLFVLESLLLFIMIKGFEKRTMVTNLKGEEL